MGERKVLDKPLHEVCMGTRDIQTLVSIYPDAAKTTMPLITPFKGLNTGDRMALHGFAVFIKMAGPLSDYLDDSPSDEKDDESP